MPKNVLLTRCGDIKHQQYKLRPQDCRKYVVLHEHASYDVAHRICKCHSWLLIKALKKHTAGFARNPAVCSRSPLGLFQMLHIA